MVASEGVLLVDKPAGVTSHDVVALARRVTNVRRIGHAGTLDPFATGLLVLLVGRGTRLLPYVDGEPKVYHAVITFGVETDTDDVTGSPVRTAPLPSPHAVRDAIPQFTGVLDQTPPAYSAKKIGGRRAYDAARSGEPVLLPPSRVSVNNWDVLRQSDDELEVRITCGGGTYIRSLARDLGRATGSAAHLTSLRRLRSGPFDVAAAASIERLREGDVLLAPLRSAIPSLPVRTLDDQERIRVGHGNPIPADSDAGRVALVDAAGQLIAIADRTVDATLQPKLVLHDA
jgi:tRNA pseudouridine55 synthase